MDLVLTIDAGVKSSREFSDDNDNSNSSFNKPSIVSHAVVKSSGESSDDGNESSNSSSFWNKESPVAMSDLDSECEISHEGHDDIQSKWKAAYAPDGLFQGDPRGLSVQLSTDGVNPFSANKICYSMWPIMLSVLNWPKVCRHLFENVMLVGVIPANRKGEA